MNNQISSQVESGLVPTRSAVAHASPVWLDRHEYPFTSHWLTLEEGRIHYVDEGRGEPILFVHGTPTWSFMYRHQIRALSPRYRCIAPDHLGFGLSDKPLEALYRPADHARRLWALIEHLELRDLTMVVDDLGGPIGLSLAIAFPERVKRLVVSNTFLWSLADDRAVAFSSRLFASPLGKFLYTRLNFSPRVMLRSAMHRKPPARLFRHYLAPFPTPASRQAPWVMARELLQSSDFFDAQWQQRERLRGRPTLLIWGMRDFAFKADALDRFKEVLGTDATVVYLPDVGHCPSEEASWEFNAELENFLASHP